MKKKLTPKQAMFVKQYLIDLNATDAARRSGYSEDSAENIGWENVRKPLIRAAIDKGMAKRNRKADVDALFIIEELKNRAIGYKTSSPNASVRSLELLGKHGGMFTDKIEHGGRVEMPVGFLVNSNGKKQTVGNRIQPDSEADGGDDVPDGSDDD